MATKSPSTECESRERGNNERKDLCGEESARALSLDVPSQVGTKHDSRAGSRGENVAAVEDLLRDGK